MDPCSKSTGFSSSPPAFSVHCAPDMCLAITKSVSALHISDSEVLVVLLFFRDLKCPLLLFEACVRCPLEAQRHTQASHCGFSQTQGRTPIYEMERERDLWSPGETSSHSVAPHTAKAVLVERCVFLSEHSTCLYTYFWLFKIVFHHLYCYW